MPELDLFEARFVRSYRRYLAEAPTEVDAAAMARTTLDAMRRRRVPVWSWSISPARVLAWLTVLGLLAALAAAAFFVGAQKPSTAFACPAGSRPAGPGPAEQARPPWAYVQAMAFDSRAGRIIAHAKETWAFDVCSNTWTAMHPAVEAPEFANSLVYDAASDLTLTIIRGRLYAYDLTANTWRRLGATPAVGDAPHMVYDPRLALIVVAAMDRVPIEMWTYDVDADRWTHIDATGAPTRHQRPVMAYDASVDRIVVYDGGLPGTWLFDPRTGEWTTSSAMTPSLGYDWAVSGQEIAYDGATGLTVAFSGGKVVAYDASADRWQVLRDARGDGTCADLTCIGRPAFLYDPVNRRLVAYGSEYATPDNWYRGDGVFAFDASSRRWTTLLAPTGSSLPH
jgi:hypothetical protein